METLSALFVFSAVGVVFGSNDFPRPSSNQNQTPQCLQKMTQGLCLAYIERFFYNATAETCQQFVYGGCQGNQNNFPSFDACMTACQGTKSDGKKEEGTENTAENICSLPKQPGLCYANFKHFYFNGKECESFIYGGCMGNANNFETLEECNKACNKKDNQVQETALIHKKKEEVTENATKDICSLPKQPGLCYARFENFYFNGKECESFIYGGCMGNENNFKTLEECNKACNKKDNEA